MIRYLTEADVKQLLTMKDTLALVEEALKARAEGRAIDIPRVRTHAPQGTLHVLEAVAYDLNRIGYKVYYSSSTGTRSLRPWHTSRTSRRISNPKPPRPSRSRRT